MADEKSVTEQASIESAMSAATPPAVAALQRVYPDWVLEVVNAFGETTLIVPRERIVEICGYLKTTPGIEMDFLADLCAVDRGPEDEPRFEVNYHLFSTALHHRLRLKVLLGGDDPHVDSLTSVWRTANWLEREVFDLMGIVFDGHPDPRRILMPEDAVGHPLRKDYPLRGYEPYSLK